MDKLKWFISTKAGLWLLFIVWALFVSNLWLPRNWGFYGTGDWDLTYSTFELARLSIIDYGEWPSYQPFLAFGSDLNANPQSVHASVFLIPVLFLGSFYGYKLSILLALIIGLWGAFKLFLKLGADNLIAVLMGIIFVAAPYFSRHIFEAGHSNFLHLYFLPWILHHLICFRENKTTMSIIWPVLLLTQMLTGGAPFIFLMSIGLIILWGIGLIWINKSAFKILGQISALITIILLLSLWKIIPVMELWKDSPRLVTDDSGINILTWLQALGDYRTDTKTPHEWHEISIGFPIVLIVINAYYLKNIKDYKKWILILIPLIWLSLGNTPSYFNPWYLFNHYVPIFSSLRAPYRLGVLSLLILSISFVISSRKIEDKRFIYIILIGLSFSQTLSFNAISNQMVFSPRIDDIQLPKLNPQAIVLNAKEQGIQYLHLQKGRFIPDAYEPLNLETITDTPSTLINGGELLAFSPGRLLIKAMDSTVDIGLRYSQHWHLKSGGELTKKDGLISIKEASGNLELFYENESSNLGNLISLITLIAFIILMVFYQMRLKKNQSLITN